MYRVQVSNDGGYRFVATSGGSTFDIDALGSGITPPAVLLASLASCVGVYIRKYAEGAKIDLPRFAVSAEADFSKERPVCFRSITVSISLEGAPLDDRRKSSFVSFIKNCPVHNTLKSNPEVNIEVTT